MTDLEMLGYGLRSGLWTPPLSYNETMAAIEASHRHSQLYEIDLRDVIRSVVWWASDARTDARLPMDSLW